MSGRNFSWWVFLFLKFSFCLLAAPPKGYDEVFDENGRVRPHYADAYIHWLRMDQKEKEKFARVTKKDFQNDNSQSLMPRVLTESEKAELDEGTRQLGETMKAFVVDHYSGKRTYLNKVIPEDVIDRVVSRTNEEGFSNYVKGDLSKRVFFDFGPDTFRGHDGKWRFYELNHHFIGLKGDLRRAREIFEKRQPELAKIIQAINDPEEYYDQIRELAKAAGKKGKLVLLNFPPYADKEDSRLIDLLGERGFVNITPGMKNRKLVTTDKGVFLETRDAKGKWKREPVGFLYVNGEQWNFDGEHPAMKKRTDLEKVEYILEEKWGHVPNTLKRQLRKALKPDPKTNQINHEEIEKLIDKANFDWTSWRGKYHDLFDAILSGKVQTNMTPGTEFIDDKELAPFLPALAKHYGIADELIINPVRTRSFWKKVNGKMVLDKALLKEVEANKDQYVIKVVDGRGGEGVHVGPKVSNQEWKEAVAAVRKGAGRFQVQDFDPPSVIADEIADNRTLAIVHPKGVYVSSTSASRAVNKNGNGKVNISDKGAEMVVLVVRDCANALSVASRSAKGRNVK